MAAIMRLLAIAILLTARHASAADVVKGKELFRGCAGCHSSDTDVRKSGPSLRTLFGKVMLVNGKRATEENVRDLILEGYNRMPSYRYQFRPEEFDDLLAFLKTLNARPNVAAKGVDPSSAGKELFTAYCERCHGANSKNGLQGKFTKEHPLNETAVRQLIEEGHGGMAGMRNWLDAAAIKALIAYLKSI